ncbi:MAG: tRNA (adenosine(37)-N6)-threonylcarbamoyltransferase complex dimerization subunit type 1 TsaB [Candidatus Marinimicrobia bacterium]|nr:tRNA (adenosine(37)-N6)-threonylcarbamoyltransferase complex dimerization subunit type 1 TsaB [Candidatus Neomarinimicrobiota bacterium]|tara:strand:+ start:589 stop:1200 length:612 start_codon:yes stop_codon:yes gene_type:complete
MTKILALETSGSNCGAGIWIGPELISIREETGYKIHSETLPEFVKSVLKESNITLGELDAIAISAGPGSYTGLRIGMSFAKGLAFGSNIQLFAINTIFCIEDYYKNIEEFSVLVYSHADFIYKKNNDSERFGNIIQTKIKDVYNNSLLCVNFPKNKQTLPNSKYILPSVKYIGEYTIKNYLKLDKLQLNEISPGYFSEFDIRK